MAKENDGQTLRDYGNRKKRYRRRRNRIIYFLLFVIVVIGIVYLFRLYNKSYQGYEVMNSEPNKGENTSGYLSYGSAVIKYSKDGAVAIDNSGSLLWNGSYEMMDPIAETCGKYVVIADRGNKLVHIYNGKGAVGSITTQYNITKAVVSAQGVVAVLMEDGEANYIKLYYTQSNIEADNEDDMLVDMKKDVNTEGYPMDIALSEDGEKLIISFLMVNTGKLESTIGFWNFGEVGQNYTDGFTGGFNYPDIVIPRVTFLNNDVACVYKDNGLMLYSMMEIPKLIYEEDFDRKIKSVIHDREFTGVVLEGDESTPKQILLYDLKGKKVLDKQLNFDYDKIFLAGEEIVMYDNLSCLILKTNGKEKFRYTFDGNIAAFYPINNLDRYFFINASEISEILLVESKNK